MKSPTAATIDNATVASTPGIVISRRNGRQLVAWLRAAQDGAAEVCCSLSPRIRRFGRRLDMDRTDFVAPAGAPETWEVDNRDGSPHTFHVHGTSFTVRDVDGRPPPAALSGWKDTVYVAPGTRLRLVLRLPDTPDPSWRTCTTATCSGTRTPE